MEHFLKSAVVATAALFPIVNPIGIVPTFLSMTRELDEAARRRQALKGAVATIAILTVFLFFGRFVLDFFGISLAAIEFVGGLIVGYVGWQMLSQSAGVQTSEEEGEVYFSPLAFPLLAGPGALAVVMGLANRHDHWLDFTGFVFGIVLVAAISYLILDHAHGVLTRMGPKGVDVVSRILALIVLAIAAELVFHGVADHFVLETAEH